MPNLCATGTGALVGMVRYPDLFNSAIYLIYVQLEVGGEGDVKSLFAPLALTRIYVTQRDGQLRVKALPIHKAMGKYPGGPPWSTKSPNWAMIPI